MRFGYDAPVLHRAKDITHDVSNQHNLCGSPMSASLPPSIEVAEVLQRMRQVTETRSDTGLAAALAMTSASVSNWRSRGVVPYQACAGLAETYGVSLDWLIFGRLPVQDPEGPARSASPQAARITQFVLNFDASHSSEDMVWLEQHIKRTVPEYAAWLDGQAN